MNSNRGMKKWLPFSSLIEQSSSIQKMLYEKNKVPRPLVSTEQARKIDTILRNYNNETLNMQVYIDGYLYKLNTPIYKIDLLRKEIELEDVIIKIKDIIDIENPNIFDEIC